MGQGSVTWEGNERREAIILCQTNISGQISLFHTLGEQMMLVGGEVASSVFKWMDAATH